MREENAPSSTPFPDRAPHPDYRKLSSFLALFQAKTTRNYKESRIKKARHGRIIAINSRKN
jgi:hypothetical protein